MSSPIRPSAVVKVGGSLLDWPELPGRLTDFLESQLGDRDRIVLVVGGGRTVDVIRDLDRAHRLGESRAHELALYALDLTARILGQLLPNTRPIADDSGIRTCWDAGMMPILAPSRLVLKSEDRPGSVLPASWDVTSDSIAAWIAGRLQADRLVLLKSTDVPVGSSRSQAAALGLVDSMFPMVARSLKQVQYRNLRDDRGVLLTLADGE